MNAEHWQKVKNILENALEKSPESRFVYLEEFCGEDEDLRREVENLLEFEQPEADLLESDVVAAVLQNDSSIKNLLGKRIGNYKISGELGSGGMGTVFLGERVDGEFRQIVALKLIKRGMDSDAVLRRFYNERQILASLEHPNIARLVDGGTTEDGLPYFVMEYVEGANILDYAAAKNLKLEERLKLFREICAAVSFAHQNLIVHRDLKPSNILITRDGKTKLLDFGIAKLLKSDAENQTATQNFIFTPEYASPEQVRGEKLTTATDIYSLGVILYELLTGRRPYRTGSKSIAEIIKSVCETEPERPSSVISYQLSVISKNSTNQNSAQRTTDNEPETNPKPKIQNLKSLKGDLDNIILKALRKESDRRYSSVEQFSEDIRRHLEGLPVTASKDSWNYRAGKFLRRNRISVGFAALVLIVLIGGISGTTWQAIRAERMRAAAEIEREKAVRRTENLRKISNSLVSEIERAIRDLPGSLPARQMLLARAVEQLDALALESEDDTDLQLELVWAYQNLAALPDKKLSESDKIYRKALVLTEQILASGKADTKARDRLAMLYLDMIVNSRLRGDVDFTLEYNTKAVETVERILRDAPDEAEYQDSFWTANYHYALTMQQLGRAQDVIETGTKILPAAENLYRTNPPNTDKYNFMKPHLTRLAIGAGLNFAGEYEAAINELKKALEECRAEQIKRPDEQILRRNESNILIVLAAALENSGDWESGFNTANKTLFIREKLSRENPSDPNFEILFADAELFIGQMLLRKNESSKAAPKLRRALQIYEKIVAADEERSQTKALAAAAKSNLGDALAKTGNESEGVKLLREAVFFYEQVNAAGTIDANLKSRFAETLEHLADALNKKNPSEADEFYRRSLNLWNDLQTRGTIKKIDVINIEKLTSRLENQRK